MTVYLIIFNDGVSFRIEEIWFNQHLASNSRNTKGDSYQIIEFKTKDLPLQDNGLNHIREIVLEEYEIE